jgi:2'-5' RNA ligase
MPVFASFEEAWTWFSEGGGLEAVEERREALTQGRAQFLSFQAPMTDRAVAALAEAVHDAAHGVEGVVLVPREQLHLTIRAVGFQVLSVQRADDVTRESIASTANYAASALKAMPPVDVTVGPVNVFPDALVLEVRHDGALDVLRERLSAIVESPDPFPVFLPHVTVATWSAGVDEPSLRQVAMKLRELEPVGAKIGRVELARWWFTGFDEREEVELEVVRSYRLR